MEALWAAPALQLENPAPGTLPFPQQGIRTGAQAARNCCFSPARDKPPAASAAMPGAARIVPEWKNLKSQICQKLQMPKELPEAGPGTPVLLSDRPSLVYRASRHPHLMPRICFYPTATANVFVCFSWGGPGLKQDQARVWLQHVADESVVVEQDVPMAQRVKVLQLSYVPSLRLLATYCDDLHLRLFGDHSQGLRLLTAVRCPHSITSMCYSPETGELVTGAIGAISFWAFSPGPAPGLGIAWAVSVAGGEFVHCLSVERDVRALVALCENTIRLYDCQRRAETQAFQLSPGVSLTCCSAHGPQGLLYVGDLAGHVQLWSLETGRQEQQFKAHLSAVTSVVCRPATHTLLTASLDGLLKEWSLGAGELLRRLDLGEPLFQLSFVTERLFYCRSQHSFCLRTLRSFSQLFSAPGSGLRRLARVPCGPGRARILATTEDGVTRFLSSVTGELLLLTWPFHRLEKALDYAYDPEREELVVTVGTADVYVLDTTICPSPAKYVVCTTENRDDKVLCLAFCRLGLGTQPSGFVFSGHRSGHVRLVSQHAHSLAERQIHKGGVGALCSLSACGDLSYRSPESNFLCSYGADERIVLSDVGLTGSELELRPLVVIPSTGCRIQSLLLVPGYLCALTEQNRLRLWRQATLVPRKINPYWLETCALHSCSVTSLDYCHPLQLLLTGGADGSVRVWSLTGVLLVDFDTSLQFSRVCFASLRGDLLLGCSTNIYFISCLEYLPRRHLKALAAWQVEDDVVEHPLPFLPNFLLSFDTVFVPRYLWAGEKPNCYQGMEALTSHRAVMLVKRVARVVASAKTETGPSPGPEAHAGVPELAADFRPARTLTKRPLCSPVEPQAPGELVPLLQKHLLPGGPWLIGPDGYIPNSIIRAQLWPLGTPLHLQCSLTVTPRRRLPPRKPAPVQEPAASRWWEEPAEKGKAKRKPQDQPTSFVDPELPRDVLAEIVAKNWLRHRPSELTLESVLRAVLSQLEDGPLSAYSLCTAALVQICQAYVLPPQLQAEAAARLYQGTASENSRIRQAAWETLGEMALLSHRDVVPLARALLDPDWQVRDQARSLITSVAGITDKFALQKAIRRQVTPAQEQPSVTISGTFVPYGLGPAGPEAEKPGWAPALLGVTELEILLAQVETRLTEDLYLAEERPEPRARGSGTRIKWPKVSEVLSAEAAAAEPTQGQAKRQQLFGQTQLPRSSGAAKDAPGTKKKRRLRDKLPQIQPGAQHLTAPIMVPSGERLGPGSEAERRQGPGSEAERRQGPGSEAERRQGPGSEAERRQGPAGAPGSLSSEVPKVTLPKVGQPPLGPRQDPRTKRYQETLKRQMLKTRQPGEPLSWQPSQPSAQAIRPESSDPFVIDPSHRYGADSAHWRDDLCKLLNLRVAPSADGRSALEELVASTRLALGQRSSSWSLGKSSSTVGRGLAERDAAAEELVAKLGMRLAQEAWAKRAEGGLAEGVPAEGGLAVGVPAEGGLAEGGLAVGVPAEGGLAVGGLAVGVPAEGGLAEGGLAVGVPAEGAEQVLGGRASKAPAARPEELARGSPGAVAGGVEGQVWQRIQPLLEILADPARLESTDTAELLGRLQALGQCPSVEHRVALESTLAMAAQVLGEEDAGLGRAVSLCALLASPGQQLPEATVSTELLQGQPGPATELLASAQARLQASAERMGQEWAWWEQVARPGQSSPELAAPREDEAARRKTQPPALWLGRARAQPRRLQQREAGAGGRREQAGAVPVGSQREKVDLYLPDRLPTAGAGWAEEGARRLPGEDTFLALYQVLVTLQRRHGPFSPAWWEQFHRLTKLYGLRRPLSRALIQQLGAADRHSSKSLPGLAQEPSEASLGQRILYQILHRGPQQPPQPPSFCGVIPLSYQNNVHVLQPRGEARYGAVGLAWRTAQQDGRGQQPKLHLGVG
ncbi:WD repeat-containing protein 87 isoform X2 [Mauremys mutica]|uniref:WD repeat-containing protein 87 isoform X2 n=1 Tax=Mauremys mutica TaxID=74926 RepID=UPI001D16F183|nr:WD repeat-containing protein 87 isoform X2 [Mauremys mutica]